MNGFTGTPVNTVLFDALLSIALGLLVFAGDQAINAVFALSVTGLYFAYAIPIIVRFIGDNDFKPGPFNLGRFVSVELDSKSMKRTDGSEIYRVYPSVSLLSSSWHS